MSQKSTIEWTQMTWNPVTGCSKISEGCKNCYAERMAYRLKAMGNRRYRNGFSVTLQDDLLELPLHWKKPRLVFVNSMSDLFHERVPLEFIKKVFYTIERCPQHTFQILTKRSHIALELSDKLSWPKNIWMGVTVESNKVVSRIDDLRNIPSNLKFLSCEPLLSALPNLNLDHIDWVIVGGESGPHARLIKEGWVTDIRDQCIKRDIPFFFKQWGGTNKKKTGRLLEGKIWDEMPISGQ